MAAISFSKLSLGELRKLVDLVRQGIGHYDWLEVDGSRLDADMSQRIQFLQDRLNTSRPHLLNEATMWSRFIYPLLSLAERDDIQAWSQVSLDAKYPEFELDGVADGVLARCIDGYLEAPYLVIVEAKKGLDAENPMFQLYGQLLAAARMNWMVDGQEPQEVFGCYTISDSWTFFRAEVEGMTGSEGMSCSEGMSGAIARPRLYLESSREYSERLEAEAILKILKGIVARKSQPKPELQRRGDRF